MERNIIESSFIKHSFENNLNQSVGLYKLDNFLVQEINKMYAFSRRGKIDTLDRDVTPPTWHPDPNRKR